MIFVRENYPNMQRENSCPFCSTEENPVSDSQEHLLECEYLKSTDSELCHLDGKYDDIFSENQVKQANMTILLESKYNARKKILENLVKQSNPWQPKTCHQVNPLCSAHLQIVMHVLCSYLILRLDRIINNNQLSKEITETCRFSPQANHPYIRVSVWSYTISCRK